MSGYLLRRQRRQRGRGGWGFGEIGNASPSFDKELFKNNIQISPSFLWAKDVASFLLRMKWRGSLGKHMSSTCSDFHPVPTIVGDNIKGIVPPFFNFFKKKKKILKKFGCPGTPKRRCVILFLFLFLILFFQSLGIDLTALIASSFIRSRQRGFSYSLFWYVPASKGGPL